MKTVLLTGALGGLEQAITSVFQEAGYFVLATDQLTDPIKKGELIKEQNLEKTSNLAFFPFDLNELPKKNEGILAYCPKTSARKKHRSFSEQRGSSSS